MKKNIFKVLACVLAVTLTLTGTGTVTFAAESGAEDSGTSSGTGTFSFSVADLFGMAAEETATEEVTVDEEVAVNEEPAVAVEEAIVVEEVAVVEEPVATTEVTEMAVNAPVQTHSAEVTVSAPVQTYSAKARSAKAPSVAKTSSNGSFNLGDFWTIGSFNLGSFWDMMEKASNTPKEPEYVTVSTYYCNCNGCFHTTDYNALKQHMLQHVLKGERNSYHTVVEKVKK